MKKSIMVSVVIPTYNRAFYLEQAINSLLTQSYKNIEIIIVDDGSIDRTAAILRQFRRFKNIKFLKNRKNLGQAKSLNLGWRGSSGDFLMYLSSDDYLEFNAIDELVKFISTAKFDIVYAGYNCVDNGGNLLKVISPLNFSQRLLTENLICFPGPATIMRRSVFVKLGGWNSKLSFYGDLDFWLRASDFFSFGKLNLVLSNYRIHKTSGLISKKSLKKVNQIFIVVNNYWRKKNQRGFIKSMIHAELLSVRMLILSEDFSHCFSKLMFLYFQKPNCLKYIETYRVSLIFILKYFLHSIRL